MEIKNTLLKIYSILPPEVRWGRVYSDTTKLLTQTEKFSGTNLKQIQIESLNNLLLHAIQTVPKYKSLKISDFPNNWPIVSKSILNDSKEEYISTKFPNSTKEYCATGGTSGEPFEFYLQKRFSEEREKAFIYDLWQRNGFSWNSKIARLRGDVFSLAEVNKGNFIKRIANRYQFNTVYAFSSFHMSNENLKKYVQVIKENNIEFLHAYFSSASIFAQFLIENKIKLSPPLKGIFCGSENLYDGQRELISAGFGCKMFSWYGHSEKCVLAGECEKNSYYHVYPQYGYLELLDENDNIIKEVGKVGTIVGTGFNNYLMPFIRYRTDDFAEYVSLDGCPDCGRKYPLLKSIKGRWAQEHLVNADGNLISITAINVHSDLMKNVKQYQFYQDKVGFVELHIIPKSTFSDYDNQRIINDLRPKLGDKTEIVIKMVESVHLSKMGKYQFINQKLKLN